MTDPLPSSWNSNLGFGLPLVGLTLLTAAAAALAILGSAIIVLAK